MFFQHICRRPLGREPGKVALMRCSVVNGFDVITKGRARRSRWPTSWTRRSPARGRGDGGRRGAGVIGHFEIPHRLANARRDPDTLNGKRDRATLQGEGQPRSTQPRLTETPKASGPGPRTPALLIPAPVRSSGAEQRREAVPTACAVRHRQTGAGQAVTGSRRRPLAIQTAANDHSPKRPGHA